VLFVTRLQVLLNNIYPLKTDWYLIVTHKYYFIRLKISIIHQNIDHMIRNLIISNESFFFDIELIISSIIAANKTIKKFHPIAEPTIKLPSDPNSPNFIRIIVSRRIPQIQENTNNCLFIFKCFKFVCFIKFVQLFWAYNNPITLHFKRRKI